MPEAAHSYDLPPSLLEASHVLVESPPMGRYRYDACRTLCLSQGPPDDLLVVTYRRIRPERFRPESDDDWSDRSVDVVSVRPDSPSPAVRDDLDDLAADVSVTGVSPSASLTKLGVILDTHLQEYEGTPAVCFDSVTSLILYSDVSEGQRFLNSLRACVDDVNGHAHYHLDPSAHDEKTRARLRTQFDAAVTIDDDGEVTSVDQRSQWAV